MKRLSEELQVRAGNNFRIDDFDNNVQIMAGDTGNIRDYTPDRNQEWFLEATVRVTFWANRAQRASAEEVARCALMHGLYSDVLAELAFLGQAVSDGDRERCFASLSRIDRVLNGKRS
jgi:hypothetical protein